MSGSDLAFLLPVLLAASGIAVYILARARPAGNRARAGGYAAAFLAGGFGILLLVDLRGRALELGPVVLTNSSHLGALLGLLATGVGAVACLFSMDRVREETPVQLYYPLLIFAVAGAVAVGMCRDLFTLFVMVELSAVPTYALVAYDHRADPKALGAAVKYLLQGVAGTLTALLGVAVLYLQGGTLSIAALPEALRGADPVALALAGGLVLAGYGVKLAIVPLHAWLPDAYCRAPAAVTAVMSGATKAGVLVALFLCLSALPAGAGGGPPATALALGAVLCAAAVLTMTAGNLMALGQSDLRRVLAYSSVAQMGYILLGFGLGMRYGIVPAFEAGLFYAVAYSIMKAGAFLGADLLASSAGTSDTLRMKGAGARHPAVGLSMAVFLLGLVGVPATAGFPGKLLVFEAGMSLGTAAGLALVLTMAVNGAISLGYYVPVLSSLLFRGPGAADEGGGGAGAGGRGLPVAATAGVVVLAVATVLLGLFPAAVSHWFVDATRELFPGGLP